MATGSGPDRTPPPSGTSASGPSPSGPSPSGPSPSGPSAAGPSAAGTPARPSSHPGGQLTHQLTIVGWLLLAAQFGFLLSQLERARTIDGTRFSTAWGQRIETMSFLILPPNLVVLVPSAIAAAVAVAACVGERSPWLDALLRTIAAVAITLIAVAFVSILEIGSRAGELEVGSIFFRLGGMSMAAGIAVLCRIIDTWEWPLTR